MRALAAVVALVGCAEPISNQVFYDEASYLAALPTSERFHAPAAFLDLDPADPVLRAASESAGDLADLYAPMTLCGEALVDTEPDVRGDTFRTWDLVPVVVVTGQGTYDWWVRGTVTSIDGARTWTLEGAQSRVGPWRELASGRHEPSDAGYVAWRLDWLGDLVGVETPAVLEHVYATDADGVRTVEARLFGSALDTEPIRYWGAQGEVGLSWTGLFEVTTDGATWPGVAVAVHTENGGRADGAVWTGETGAQVPFGRCWDAAGATVWSGGDPAVSASGEASACAFDALVDPAR